MGKFRMLLKQHAMEIIPESICENLQRGEVFVLSLKAQFQYYACPRQPLVEELKRSGLTILSGTVDDEVFARLHILRDNMIDFFVGIDHIMNRGNTRACNIEIFLICHARVFLFSTITIYQLKTYYSMD